ncbi:MAG TPA: hypothetical protein PLK94_07575 [Alphaproteobacteria bacterium]|nr:hypothetical protein [Alphaproteobacteria bacterium]HOO51127.1 hypothetical protein [Alphaproteobacteria bacterium]
MTDSIDPTKVERTPNGLIIDRGRGSLQVHEFAKHGGGDEAERAAHARAQNAQAEAAELANREKRIAMGLEKSPPKTTTEKVKGFLKSKWGVATLAVGAVATTIGVSLFDIGGNVLTMAEEATGVGAEIKTAHNDVLRKSEISSGALDLNPDGSFRNPQRSLVDDDSQQGLDLGAYQDAFQQTRDFVLKSAGAKELNAQQTECVVGAYDSALRNSAARAPLAGEAGRSNIGNFAAFFEKFGEAQMEICQDQTGVPEGFAKGINGVVFEQDGQLMSQLMKPKL